VSVDQGLSALVEIIIQTSGVTRNLLFVGDVEKRLFPPCKSAAYLPVKSGRLPVEER
jgi:hypothetical protein